MTYRVHEFAELAGVTVKALYHYDRLGILRVARNASGYRIYSERDLERLEYISALRFLGVPLKKIGPVLEGAPGDLREILKLQRRALEEKQRRIGQALEAIAAAEKATGTEATNWLIMAVQSLQVDLSKHFSPESLESLRQWGELGRSAEWKAEFSKIRRDALAGGPASDAARARFRDFIERHRGDFPPVVPQEEMVAAAKQLPPGLKRLFEKSDVARVVGLLMKGDSEDDNGGKSGQGRTPNATA